MGRFVASRCNCGGYFSGNHKDDCAGFNADPSVGRSGDQLTAQGILRMLTLKEAIASVSLSHPENCDCLTCRAGRGDEEAFEQIAADLEGSL